MFVLLLVILLPLTGCIDLSDNAEGEDNGSSEMQQNHYPVIFGTADFRDYWHSSNSTTSENVLVTKTAYAIDFDGMIAEFGIDVNEDGLIDFPITNSTTGASWQMVENTDNNSWMNPLEYDTWGPGQNQVRGDVNYCYQWLSMIAIDNDGAMTVKPFMVAYDWDNEAETCMLEHN